MLQITARKRNANGQEAYEKNLKHVYIQMKLMKFQQLLPMRIAQIKTA